MFTPQQIDQISFSKSTFGGYNMQQVDEFLEPLTEDYVTLYKENALLKSKMRVLVGKLEEYRKNEAAMKEAVVNAQQASDKRVREAEAKYLQMLKNADVAPAAPTTPAAPSQDLAAENARVEEARRAVNSQINDLQQQMRSCIDDLERLKTEAPAPAEIPEAPAAPSMDMAEEISQNIEAIVGTTVDTAPVAPPRHPVNADSITSKFASLNLQFGRNYDPAGK